jgi:hypothetical protein
MASYNPTNQSQMNIASAATENKGIFNRLLRNLSNFGMKYDDMIIRNTVGIGMNEDPLSQKNNDMYAYFSQRAVAQVLNRKAIPYLDKSYADKRRILREYSIKDSIRDYIAIVADEAIIFNGQDFCSPKPLSNSFSSDIRDKYQEFFEKIYNKFGFSDGITAWNMMKDFLIDGFIALEIVWDDKKQNIIHFNRLRPDTLVPSYEPTIGNLWIQYPEDPQLRRIFLDSQLIFISYTTQNDFSETSYIEGLIKPYNQLKIIEQTRIMFNIINATVYQKFTIPTKGLSRQKAEEQIGQLIANYSEHVEWDDSLGTLTINGSKHLPYNKQLWFPDGDQGTPAMELVSPTGNDLNEEGVLKYFANALKRASKIPFPRFEFDGGGGSIFTMESADVSQEEQQFANFVGRIRANFKEVIIKPLKLQICMEFPELKDNEVFLNQIDIMFSSNQTIEEWKRIKTYTKKIEAATSILALQKPDGTPYFHVDFIVNNILKLSQQEIEENNAYWIKSKTPGAPGAAGAAPGTTPAAPTGGEGGSEFEFGAQGGAPAQGAAPAQGGEAGAQTPPAQGGQAGAQTPPAQGGAQGGTPEFEF